jgi:cell division protein FtsB
MAEKPNKAPARSLEELLQVSKELQARSAELTAEAQALSKKSAEIAERVKRLWDQRRD